jgi:hypothetical protein
MKKPKLARVFWLSVFAPAFGNIANFGNVGILSLLSLTVSLNQVNQVNSVAIAAEGRQWEYDPYTNQLQITSKEKPEYFILANPPRIVIDVPRSNFGRNPTQESYPGLVQSIRISEFKPGETRIVMDLDPAISIHPGQITLEPLGQGDRWVLRPQIALSQALPRVESRGTLPQLPPQANIRHQSPILGNQLGNQPESSPESVIMPPLPVTTGSVTPLNTVPINSEVGLPTQPVTPNNSQGDRPVTVNVPGLDGMPRGGTSVSEATGTTETTEIFVPPPPPPDWQSDCSNTECPVPTETASIPIPVSPSKIPAVTDSSVMTREEMELMESLPPYSEWQQVPLTGSPSVSVEASASVTPSIDSTVAEIPVILPVPATPEWQAIPAGDPLRGIAPNESLSNESLSLESSNPVSGTNESLSLMAYSSPSDEVITFGESLPRRSNAEPPVNSVNSVDSVTAINVPNLPNNQNDLNNVNTTAEQIPVTDPNVLVAAGTMIILSYPGSEGFTVKSGSSRREVLVVNVEVYDRNGNAIAPVGTPAIGTFISDRSGIRFVLESIVINGEMVSIKAESNPIAGDMAISRNGLLSWSTLGAIGGAAIGGLAGGPLLGGAAAGIAANLLSSPKEVAIAPGQVLPVRLTEHWRAN